MMSPLGVEAQLGLLYNQADKLRQLCADGNVLVHANGVLALDEAGQRRLRELEADDAWVVV